MSPRGAGPRRHRPAGQPVVRLGLGPADGRPPRRGGLPLQLPLGPRPGRIPGATSQWHGAQVGLIAVRTLAAAGGRPGLPWGADPRLV